jgi:hypothetical protein
MPAYRKAVLVDDAAPAQTLRKAARMLERSAGVVMLGGVVALRPAPQAIRCEVIDPAPDSHRCAEEFRVLIENAAHALANSKLAGLLPARPLQWVVVDGRAAGALKRWPPD